MSERKIIEIIGSGNDRARIKICLDPTEKRRRLFKSVEANASFEMMLDTFNAGFPQTAGVRRCRG